LPTNTVLITMIAASRLMFSMARDGSCMACSLAYWAAPDAWVATILSLAMAAAAADRDRGIWRDIVLRRSAFVAVNVVLIAALQAAASSASIPRAGRHRPDADLPLAAIVSILVCWCTSISRFISLAALRSG
jgi:hypothetical protein